jgi:hypothetical protein
VRLRAPTGEAGRVEEGNATVLTKRFSRLVPRAGWAGPLFARLTAAPALLAVAWLLPGTGLLLAGRLERAPMVLITVPLAVALGYFALRRVPSSWPRFGAASGVSAWALLALLVIAGGFGVWQAFFRSEELFGAADPVRYLEYGYWIAGHGSALVPDSAASFGGSGGLSFAVSGFTASGSSVSSSLLPGLPLLLAGGTWAGGLNGALLMPAVLGGCALLSFGGLVGRLCGGWWAVGAELALALCLPELDTARAPFAEPLLQLLVFGGLCLFTDALAGRERPVSGPGGTLASVRSGAETGGALALAGLALGLTVLVSLRALEPLLPVVPVIGALSAAGRERAGWFGGGLVAGIGTGIAAALVLTPALPGLPAEPYLFAWAGVTVLVTVAAAPGARARVRRWSAVQVRLPVGAPWSWLPWARDSRVVLPSAGSVARWLALTLPVVVLVGLLARRCLEVAVGQGDPAVISQVAALQREQGLPVDGERTYYEYSLYWVLWYLGAPALLLGCAGASALGRRVVRAVLGVSDRDVPGVLGGPGGRQAVRVWGLPLLMIAWSVVTVLWDPDTAPWQPAAASVLVPVVLPGLVLLAVWASSWLAAYAATRGAGRAVAVAVGVCCALALALPAAVTTLNPGHSGRLTGVGTAASYGGSVAAAVTLCADAGPSASVLFTDAATAADFGPTVRELCGLPTARLSVAPSSAAYGAQLQQAAAAIEQAGRHPVLLGPTEASVGSVASGTPAGAMPRQVVALRTTGDADTLTGAPAALRSVTYSLWLSVPADTGI